jgi:hypothetical protein
MAYTQQNFIFYSYVGLESKSEYLNGWILVLIFGEPLILNLLIRKIYLFGNKNHYEKLLRASKYSPTQKSVI